MLVEYDVICFKRTLKIDIVEWWQEKNKDYPIFKELPACICDELDIYYNDWQESEDPAVYQIPLEEYMMSRLEENYGRMWSSWESVDWHDII